MKKSTFFVLCLEGAVLFFNIAASAALIPSIARDFLVPQFFAGRLLWLYMLPYGLAALFYGPLLKILDAKRLELSCMLGFSLANLSAAGAQNIYLLFASRFFTGLFGAAVVPLTLILIARHIGEKSRGKFVGIFFSVNFASSLLGLFLSGILPWRLIFLIPAVCGCVTALFIYFYLPAFKEDSAGFQINYLGIFKNKAALSLFGYIFLASLFYYGVQQWLGVYFAQDFHFSQFVISMLLTLTSFSGIFGEVIGGWSADKLGRIKTVNLGIVFMLMSVFSLLFKMPLVILAVLVFIWGLGWTFNHAGLSTLLTDLPKEFLNEAAGLNSSIRFLSGGLGTAIGGLLMQRSFTFGFGVLGMGLLFLLFFTKYLTTEEG